MSGTKTILIAKSDAPESVDKFGSTVSGAFSAGGEGDIIAIIGNQYFPAAVVPAANINITSSDAGDTLLGDGCRTLQLWGVDGDLKQVYAEVEMSGGVAAHPLQDIWFVNRAKIGAVGATLGNIGNITIADGSGVLAYIRGRNNATERGAGQTQQAAYKVPAFSRTGRPLITGLHLRRWFASVPERVASYAVVVLQAQEPGSGWAEIRIDGPTTSRAVDEPLTPDGFLSPGTNIKIRVIDASAISLNVVGGFDGELK